MCYASILKLVGVCCIKKVICCIATTHGSVSKGTKNIILERDLLDNSGFLLSIFNAFFNCLNVYEWLPILSYIYNRVGQPNDFILITGVIQCSI